MQKKLQRIGMSRRLDDFRLNFIFLSLANIFFHCVHLALVFCFFVWLSEKTLLAPCILSILILLSWLGLGMIFGYGYCLVTVIQWRLEKRMGEESYTEYYIKYILDIVTGFDTNPQTVNTVTTITYYVIFVLSIIFVFRNYSRFF